MSWNIIAQEYFDSHKLTDHQIKSFNEFLKYKFPKIIEENNLEYTKGGNEHTLNFQNLRVFKPELIDPNGSRRNLFPSECRDRMMSYSGFVYIDIVHVIKNSGKKISAETYKDINIGKIPIMIGSDWCHLKDYKKEEMIQKRECVHDPFGYFITTGKEYAIFSQDRMAHNEVFVFQNSLKNNKNQKKSKEYSHYAIVRSFNENCEPNISTTQAMITSNNIERGEQALIYFLIPGFKEEIPLIILYMAMGVNLEMIAKHVLGDTPNKKLLKILTPSLDETILNGEIIKNQNDAIIYLSQFVAAQRERKIDSVHYFLKYKFLQNIENMRLKLHNLSHIVYNLISTVAGIKKQDDRDHYAMKRIETAGSLFNNLMRSSWKSISREVKGLLEKKKNLTVQTVYDNKITTIIKKAIESGNWTATKVTKNSKTGVTDNLNRHNFVATLSSTRRVITPSEKNSKVIKPRHLHSSHFNNICPFETPEGGKTGLQKNMALISTVTLGSAEEIVIDYIKRENVIMNKDVEYITSMDNKIFVNGKWIAVGDIYNIEKKLKDLRRDNKIPREVSISIVNGLRIYTDEGRLISPFLVLKNSKIKDLPEDISWESLVSNGNVEYLDVAELESLHISTQPWNVKDKTTHCLIHPGLLVGVSASSCPFFNCNQSPRVIYQASMCKQGLGIPALNINQRNDTTSHKMIAPQTPLVESRINKMFGSNDLPTGQNLVVAILSYTGFNQEDSLLYCTDSIDMGALRSECHNTYIESNHKKGTVSSEIKLPERLNVRETRETGYTKLDSDGLPKEGTPLQKRDIVIGKVLYTSDTVKDSSVVVKVNGMEENAIRSEEDVVVVNPIGSSFVDRVLLTTDEESNKTALVKIRQTRIPQMGDKLASRSAQKGILGLGLPREDMPQCVKTGITPDIIMNPTGFPSRMTVSQPKEALKSLLCCIKGMTGDGTAYEPPVDDWDTNDVEALEKHLEEEMESYGLCKWGNTKMISGITGEIMEAKVYMCPTYYQRLKHMVDDKIHARSQNGPRDILSMQPIDGRRRGGGFRVGEMECWAGISHGASNFLIDRLVNNSDAYEYYVCDDCGNSAVANLTNKTFNCRRCNQSIRISRVKIPHSFKLMQQELMATGIGVWVET